MEKIFKVYARAVIYNTRNKILLIHKALNQKIAPGKWVLPGGTCEWGETIENALIRELKEEVNASVSQIKLIDTKTILIKNTHWQGLYFEVRVSNLNEIKNCEPDKHDDLKWFTSDHLPTTFSKLDGDVIKKHIIKIN